MSAKEKLEGLTRIVTDRADNRLAIETHNVVDAVREMTRGMDYLKIPIKTNAVKSDGHEAYEINVHVMLNYLHDAIVDWQTDRYREYAINAFMQRFDDLNREANQLLKEDEE